MKAVDKKSKDHLQKILETLTNQIRNTETSASETDIDAAAAAAHLPAESMQSSSSATSNDQQHKSLHSLAKSARNSTSSLGSKPNEPEGKPNLQPSSVSSSNRKEQTQSSQPDERHRSAFLDLLKFSYLNACGALTDDGFKFMLESPPGNCKLKVGMLII